MSSPSIHPLPSSDLYLVSFPCSFNCLTHSWTPHFLANKNRLSSVAGKIEKGGMTLRPPKGANDEQSINGKGNPLSLGTFARWSREL